MSGGAVARPPVIGLTGGIAAGKSETLAALERRGARTLSADAVVHDLLGTDEVADLLVERWGREVAPAGAVDRGRVGAIVFADAQELEWLERQLHPLVARSIAEWVGALPADAPLAVMEVPLLFETEMQSGFDATVAVVAEDDTRARRAGAKGLADFDGRGERQLTQEQKAARATFVIRNDGPLEELDEEVERLWPQLVTAGGGGR